MAEPKTTNQSRPGTTKPGTRPGLGGRQRGQKEQEADLETLVTELEQRIDRLRAAYDQYFMGIEKLPPHVQIKDVERRLADLRKIQIRNTALRFKFQNNLQKYNTYQSYWQRIVRQIEEGTYKRDVRRANERFGTGARRRGAAKEIEIDVELDDLMSEDADLGDLFAPDEDEEDAADTLRPEAPMSFEVPEIPRTTDSRRLMALDAPDTGIPFVPQRPIEERPSQKHLVRMDGRLPPPPTAQRPAPGKGLLPPVAAPRPRDGQDALPPPQQAHPHPPQQPQQPQQVPPAAGSSARRKSTAPPPRENAAVPRPAAAVPKKSVRPPAPGNGVRAAEPKPPQKPGDLSDQRLRQLYSQYVETKRAQKESTAALSYESLAKSLRESSEKLKEKHGGKKVDFEVAVKDGKTILRPVVK